METLESGMLNHVVFWNVFFPKLLSSLCSEIALLRSCKNKLYVLLINVIPDGQGLVLCKMDFYYMTFPSGYLVLCCTLDMSSHLLFFICF